jgi:hypothetical protein
MTYKFLLSILIKKYHIDIYIKYVSTCVQRVYALWMLFMTSTSAVSPAVCIFRVEERQCCAVTSDESRSDLVMIWDHEEGTAGPFRKKIRPMHVDEISRNSILLSQKTFP